MIIKIIRPNIEWLVEANCPYIIVTGKELATEEFCDILTIDDVAYSGNTNIRQMTTGNFSVNFQSDDSITGEGFIISWECLSDCFNNCGARGGRCSSCGLNGYCCSGDPEKSHLNGDCNHAAAALAPLTQIWERTGNSQHICVTSGIT